MQRQRINYRFSKSFPDSLKPAFLNALVKAFEMWEKSGVVEFWHSHVKTDFVIAYELVGKEYGDISKQLYSPKISYRNHLLTDAIDSAIIVNCSYNWKSKWYQFFRHEFSPIEIAHNLGHVMGLCCKKHVNNLHSVMFENPISPPTEQDFHILKMALSKRK